MPPFVPRKRRRLSPSPPPTPATTTSSSTPFSSRRKPNLFDALDAPGRSVSTQADNEAFLAKLQGDSSESSLSDLGSSDFEDVDIGTAVRLKPDSEDGDEDDDEEVDWEDAIAPDPSNRGLLGVEPSGDLELTLDKTAKPSYLDSSGKKKGPSKIERQIRTQTHCMHVQFLLFHNLVRNAWICDANVQSSLVAQMNDVTRRAFEQYQRDSGLLKYKNTLAVKKGKGGRARERKNRDWGGEAEKLEEGVPNLSRGDPLLHLLKELVKYWKKKFTIDQPGLRKQGYKPPSTLEAEIASFTNEDHNPDLHGERITGEEAFRKLAKEARGSRDVGAQLFTALLRGLGLEARLVASLQPVGFGWSKGEEASLKKKAKKDNEKHGRKISTKITYDDEGDEKAENGLAALTSKKKPSKSNKTRGKTKVPPKPPRARARRRGGRDDPIELSEGSETPLSDEDESEDEEVTSKYFRRDATPFDKDLAYPIYWTEVLSPITNRYVPVDPLVLKTIATSDELIASFEPRSAQAEKAKQVMAYVVAFSADGTAKDVTVRYLKRHIWPGKTKGVRMPVEKLPIYNHRGKIKRYEDLDWFKTVMSGYSRSSKQRTPLDDLEEQRDLTPIKPTKDPREGKGEETLQGYKTSAEFVLERHLRREEAVLPGSKHVKTFTTGKGDKAAEEKVFRRRDVVACKSSESWHKEGRQVKAGEQALKLVPMRAMTLNRKREIEQAEADAGGERLKQGLYSKEQTEWIIPPPIEHGIIPRNAFGNIDCFVPSMVPKGAVHLPYRGLVKICKRLDISHAEAVVGFDFKSQRAVPLVQGVVIPREREGEVMEEWQRDEEERVKREEGKRATMALGLWRKFLMGLRIIARVREEYGDKDGDAREELNPFTNQNTARKARREQNKAKGTATDGMDDVEVAEEEDPDLMGGFLPDAADGLESEGDE